MATIREFSHLIWGTTILIDTHEANVIFGFAVALSHRCNKILFFRTKQHQKYAEIIGIEKLL